MAKENRYIKTTNTTTKTKSTQNYKGGKAVSTITTVTPKKSINYGRVIIDSTILLIILILVSTVISLIVPTSINQYDVDFNTIDIVEQKTNQYDHAYDLWVRSTNSLLPNTPNNVFIFNKDYQIKSDMFSIIDIINLKSAFPNYNEYWFKVSNVVGDFSTNAKNFRIGYYSSFATPSTYEIISFRDIEDNIYFDVDWDKFYNGYTNRLGVYNTYYKYLDFSFKIEFVPKIEKNLGTTYVKYDRNILKVNEYNQLDNVVLANDFKLYKSEEYKLDVSYFSGWFDGRINVLLLDNFGYELFTLYIDSNKYQDSILLYGLVYDLNDLKLVINAPSLNTKDTMIYINLVRTSLNEELEIGNVFVNSYTTIIDRIVTYGGTLPKLINTVWDNIVYFFTLKWWPF